MCDKSISVTYVIAYMIISHMSIERIKIVLRVMIYLFAQNQNSLVINHLHSHDKCELIIFHS